MSGNFTALEGVSLPPDREPFQLTSDQGLDPAVSDKIEMKEVVAHAPEGVEGVVIHPDVVEVPADLQRLGVQGTGTSDFHTEVPLEPVLPLTDQQIIDAKKEPVTSSISWLREFCIKQLKKVHVTLKIIHGHVKRVVMPNADARDSVPPEGAPQQM